MLEIDSCVDTRISVFRYRFEGSNLDQGNDVNGINTQQVRGRLQKFSGRALVMGLLKDRCAFSNIRFCLELTEDCQLSTNFCSPLPSPPFR